MLGTFFLLPLNLINFQGLALPRVIIKLRLIMKLRLLLLGCLIGLIVPTWAQEVDVTTVLADTKTFIFDNNKNTVKGYIYAELEEKTSCCGEDRIYLEVKIDPSGYVVSAKPLTGKNDCMKQSAVDIVKNIQWDAADFKGPKSVYFEIKPNIECKDGMENAYAELEIFNNPLLNPDGTRATTPSGALVTAEGSKQEADSAKIKELLAVAGNEERSTPREPEKEPVAEERMEPTEKKFVEDESPKETEPAPTTQEEPRLPEQIAAPDGSSRGEQDPALEGARNKAAAEEIARQKEIDRLRQQLVQMREEEEKRQERLRQQEEARRKREEQMKQQQNESEGFGGQTGEDQFAADADDGAGGLYFEDNGSNDGDFNEGEGFAADSGEDDRLRNEIEDLRQRQEELRQQLRQRKEEQLRIAEENRQANQDIVRMEEEIAMKEEELAQAREEAELQRLEEERQAVAQERQQQDEEYQRMMEEIRRLQAEAEQQIKQLEEKKAEIERMEKLAKAREQEIALERALREKERQKRIMEVQNQLNTGRPVSARSFTATSEEELSSLMEQIDLSAEADSEAIKLLVQQIEQMRTEMAILQQQIRNMGGQPTTTPIDLNSGRQTTPPSSGKNPKGSTGNGNKGGATSDGVKSAATDESWKELDIYDPNVNPSEYGGAAPTRTGTPSAGNQTTPPANSGSSSQATPTSADFDPVKGYSSLADDEHENVAGPKAGDRTYIDGRGAMKQIIKTKLKQGSICGLAQALFSVTLDPKGNVVRHTILGVNGEDKAEIELQLMTIIPTLKFTKVEVRFNQTIYLEFKAEIICEGKDKVNLQQVDPILKTDN